MNWSRSLAKIIKGRVRFNEPLARHTTFKIGGPAEILVEPEGISDLIKIIRFAKKANKKIFVIGGGSNILAKDGIYRGIVVKLNKPFFRRITSSGNRIFAGSGLNLSTLINSSINKNLTGCEFLWGIPGTVGGALAANSGISWVPADKASPRDISEIVEKVEIVDFNGNKRILTRKNMQFGYRQSILAKYIIIYAVFKLKSDKKLNIERLKRDFIQYRKSTQHCNGASAGCIFKNPTVNKNAPGTNFSAGKLIDRCGLKGKRQGRAYISPRHANFIINKGGAKAADVLKLIRLAQKSVKNKFNIALEPEINIID